MNKHEAEIKIKALFEKTIEKNPELHLGILLVHSDRMGIHWKLSHGTVENEGRPVTPDHSYHIASIGKTINSALIGRLYEQERIDFNDPISSYLPKEILDNLHVYQGKNYADRILVRHLLNHTSGIADYFSDKPKNYKPLLRLVLEEPGRFWTPLETIQWAKDHLQPHFPPGKGFHYSDTGYQLLGLIIEKITGKPLHENQQEIIFDPLEMRNSFLLFYSEPRIPSPYPMAEVYLDKIEVSKYRSISIDWAGGGIISTTEDLLRFHRALTSRSLLREDTLVKMRDWAKFSLGIQYGYGFAELHFNKMFFLLSKKMDLWGNFGSIATFMFYNPALDVFVIGAFNQSKYVRRQVNFILKTLFVLRKL